MWLGLWRFPPALALCLLSAASAALVASDSVSVRPLGQCVSGVRSGRAAPRRRLCLLRSAFRAAKRTPYAYLPTTC